MSASSNRRWLAAVVVLAIALATSAYAFDPSFGVTQHLTFAILPCIGTLAILPSDPGAWIAPDERPSVILDAYVPAVPPRAPPV